MRPTELNCISLHSALSLSATSLFHDEQNYRIFSTSLALFDQSGASIVNSYPDEKCYKNRKTFNFCFSCTLSQTLLVLTDHYFLYFTRICQFRSVLLVSFGNRFLEEIEPVGY
jgi:hypothetical protein